MMRRTKVGGLLAGVAWSFVAAVVALAADNGVPRPIRAGLIGLDTSHVVAFTTSLNDPNATRELAGVKIVAAYPAGSPDLPLSWNRVKGFTETLRGRGVAIVDSIDELLKQVDVVFLESVDGRVHLAQARPVIAAGKPLFIDKPMAASLSDAMQIFRLAKEKGVPCFSASSLRFSPGVEAARNGTGPFGDVLGCTAWSPAHVDAKSGESFWLHGIHGVETLFAVMGPGCKTVSLSAPETFVGVWKDGRVGTFVSKKKAKSKDEYGASIDGTKGSGQVGGYTGYVPLVAEIVKFLKTGKPPVIAEETLEILAFMEAADQSKRQGGAPVELEAVMKQVREAVAAQKSPKPITDSHDSGDTAPPAISGTVLNNFVTELVRLKNVSADQAVSFTNPREGWIHIVADSSSAVTASFSRPDRMRRETIVFQHDDATASSEAMKYLPAGDYRLDLAISSGATAETLLIRAIPEIFYNGYCRPSQLHECNDAARNWAFLEKYVNPNINTFVVHRAHRTDPPSSYKPPEDVFSEWHRRGKHWVDEISIDIKAASVDEAYQYYVSVFAIPNPIYDAYLIDEFMSTPEKRKANRMNVEALTRIASRPDFAGKKIHSYTGSPHPEFDDYKEVCKFAVDHHFLLAQEWYVNDKPPKKNILDCFGASSRADGVKQWDKFFPGAADSLLMTVAGWNLPDCCGDINPQVNSKVLLDWQMKFLANDPAYRNLRGINFWNTSYMDEELIRWMCQLFRHYCIKGNKNLLSTDPYVLSHLVNSDCEQGTQGWDLQMAEPGTIRAGTLKDYGKMQGRYKVPNGDHFLVARRSEKGPNVIGQTIKNLTPGRLYTFRMYTADYSDLKTGKSQRQKHVVSISVSGANPIPDRELHIPYYSRASMKFPPFDSEKKPCWSNYHWLLFRAESQTAKLMISDWVDAQRPGGEIGQELAFNFFQVEPYFASEEMDDWR